MCEIFIKAVYTLFLQRGGQASEFIEACINYTDDDAIVSDDDFRNESAIYEGLFSEECCDYLFGLYGRSMKRMKGLGFKESVDILEGLVFIQVIGATALWRFNLELGFDLEEFVRGFDRLDVFEERERLYLRAQR